MERHAWTWFTPKQKAELWERWKSWKSGQCVANIAERLSGGTRAAFTGSRLSMEGSPHRRAGVLRCR